MSLEPSYFQVSLPGDFAPILNQWGVGKSLDDRVKVSVAIGLFSGKIVSLARAAELAEISLVDFIQLLENQDIPWMEYTNEEKSLDEKAVSKLLGEIENRDNE